MYERNDTVQGPFFVEEDVAVFGMITGATTVRSGVVLELHGMVNGDLTIEPGGEAVIHGTVNGTVWNSGSASIYGTINDVVNATPECRTVIDKGALIRKRRA